MGISAEARRWTYLVHRWTGIFGCVLMLLWFLSGIVMLYVGYPKLTPWERFGAMAVLEQTGCCVGPDALPPRADPSESTVLTSIRGEPHYVVSGRDGLRTYAARSGTLSAAVTPGMAAEAARLFSGDAPVGRVDWVHEDRWTHSRGLDRHRPLLRVELGGREPTALYISSVTGEVVLDAPAWQQRWNYLGAWLHWLYMFRSTSVDAFWTWLVIVLSAICTVSALAGALVGVWRWRFQGRYKSGSRSPYREPWMRWHHIVGLLFGCFVFTWILSGLMSMNPGGIFAQGRQAPNIEKYMGDAESPAGALADVGLLLATLREQGFAAVELRWRRLGGVNYVLALDAQADSRILREQHGDLVVSQEWEVAPVLQSAELLLPFPVAQSTVLHDYDAYYYRRHAEAMNGGLQRNLPVLQLLFEDPAMTQVYIDLRTGEVVSTLSASQRVGRWLFYFLHSWDTPGLLGTGRLRELVLILLSLGGSIVCLSGIVIGWRRLKVTAAPARPVRKSTRKP